MQLGIGQNNSLMSFELLRKTKINNTSSTKQSDVQRNDGRDCQKTKIVKNCLRRSKDKRKTRESNVDNTNVKYRQLKQ